MKSLILSVALGGAIIGASVPASAKVLQDADIHEGMTTFMLVLPAPAPNKFDDLSDCFSHVTQANHYICVPVELKIPPVEKSTAPKP